MIKHLTKLKKKPKVNKISLNTGLFKTSYHSKGLCSNFQVHNSKNPIDINYSTQKRSISSLHSPFNNNLSYKNTLKRSSLNSILIKQKNQTLFENNLKNNQLITFNHTPKKFISATKLKCSDKKKPTTRNVIEEIIEENKGKDSKDQKHIFTIESELYLPLFVSPYALFPGEKLSVRIYDEAQISFLNWHQKLPQNHPYSDTLGFVPSLESSEELVYGLLPRICHEKVGTIVQILEHNDIPDGKHLYLSGLKRFNIDFYEKNPQNNFFHCSFTIFDDINGKKSSAKFDVEGEEEILNEKREDDERVKELQQKVEDLLISDLQRDEYEALQLEGSIPPSDEPIEYSFWLAAALPKDQVTYQERLQMYSTRSTILRYEIAERILRKMVESKKVVTVSEEDEE